MGSGSWSADVHTATTSAKRAAGKDDFDYSASTRSRPVTAWKVHDSLNPHGVKLRESRDSDEHPESLGIVVLFDVTGSMQAVPRALVKKLPDLFGLLLRKGYVAHPQILMGAIGDATCDAVPLQVGQFESDNRIDANLTDIFLEGRGGGQTTESYELAAYFIARHTATDCWKKRGHRGYCFIIGDEQPYGQVKPSEVAAIVGDDLAEPIPTQAIFDELAQKWDTYLIRPEGAGYRPGDREGDRIIEAWQNILGAQHVIDLPDLTAVCETIALTIGLGEDAIDLDEGMEHLDELGTGTSKTVGKALAHVGSGGAIATSEAPSDL